MIDHEGILEAIRSLREQQNNIARSKVYVYPFSLPGFFDFYAFAKFWLKVKKGSSWSSSKRVRYVDCIIGQHPLTEFDLKYHKGAYIDEG